MKRKRPSEEKSAHINLLHGIAVFSSSTLAGGKSASSQELFALANSAAIGRGRKTLDISRIGRWHPRFIETSP